MGIDKQEAVFESEKQIMKYRDVDESDLNLEGTYRASGRWRVTFDVNGVYDDVIVRLDQATGNLAGKEGHSKTSENLIP